MIPAPNGLAAPGHNGLPARISIAFLYMYCIFGNSTFGGLRAGLQRADVFEWNILCSSGGTGEPTERTATSDGLSVCTGLLVLTSERTADSTIHMPTRYMSTRTRRPGGRGRARLPGEYNNIIHSISTGSSHTTYRYGQLCSVGLESLLLLSILHTDKQQRYAITQFVVMQIPQPRTSHLRVASLSAIVP